MHFPQVEGRNLDGRPFVFPRDFRQITIAIVAFDVKQRAELESWVPFIDGYARPGSVDSFVLAALPLNMQLFERILAATLRKGAPSPEARAATIPIFVDLDDWCTSLEIADRSTIALFVVAPDGAVLGHHSGAYEVAAAAEIERHLRASA